jgi:hypothetical protein
MSNRRSITLGELQGKLTMLEVACHRCDRYGRVSLARLIEEHGADTGLPDLWESLAGDCEHARSDEQGKLRRCGAHHHTHRRLCLPGSAARRVRSLKIHRSPAPANVRSFVPVLAVGLLRSSCFS